MEGHMKKRALRRQARQYALQVLYSLELNPEPEASTDEILPDTVTGKELAFAEALVESVRSHLDEIDPMLAAHLKRWSLSQLNVVDKNILRMGVAELLYTEEKLDKKIVINEAVEMAKVFGGENSYRLVNGILNTIADENHS